MRFYNKLHVNPQLPSAIRGLRLREYFRGRWYEIAATGKQVKIALVPDGLGPAEVVVHGKVHGLESGDSITVEL